MDIHLALLVFKQWNSSQTSQDPLRCGVALASLGQTAPHLMDQAPKSPLCQIAPFYPSKNPIPPNDISSDKNSALSASPDAQAWGARPYPSDRKHGQPNSLSSKYQSSLRRAAHFCHLTQTVKIARYTPHIISEKKG